jgi:Osmosensitive K+ channel histidine kinase
MIREIEDVFMKTNDGIERVLVCITAQCNSKRLIDEGAKVASEANGELHIIHVQRGDSIFNNADTPKLLEELFDYGSKKGGMIHFYCDEHITECIGQFVNDKGITKMVLGEPPMDNIATQKEIEKKLRIVLENINLPVDVVVVKRNEAEKNMIIKRNKCAVT